jgi:hypothetical protein
MMRGGGYRLIALLMLVLPPKLPAFLSWVTPRLAKGDNDQGAAAPRAEGQPIRVVHKPCQTAAEPELHIRGRRL